MTFKVWDFFPDLYDVEQFNILFYYEESIFIHPCGIYDARRNGRYGATFNRNRIR